MRPLIALTLITCCASPGHGAEESLVRSLDRVGHCLRSNILDFWAEHAIDRERGGYVTNLDEAGGWVEHDTKYLLTQARMVWVFASAHRHGIQDRGYLELAEHGFRFLIDHMWDQVHGGFYWSVDGAGKTLRDSKGLYTQSFAIYALSEYHLASGDAEALERAEQLFDLFVRHAGDGERGFRERFTRDWRDPDPDRPQRKTLDTHMHLMECFTTLARASGKAEHRQALADLVDLLLARAIDPQGFAHARFDQDFQPLLGEPEQARTSYGHNVELAWLLLEAFEVLGRDRDTHRAAILGLIDHALAFGRDRERGGIALYGPLTGHVLDAPQLGEKRLLKSWWEQSELLVATLEAYAWTGDPTYRAAFHQTFDWIWSQHVDHERGEWYGILHWDGSPTGDRGKGNGWKCAYHNGRALMLVERRLQALLAGGG